MKLADMVAEEYGWMLSQAQRLCRNKMDAEDLTGDAVLKILCNPDRYDCGRPFRPWASVIILNTYITKHNHDSLIMFTDIDSCLQIGSECDTLSRIGTSDILSAIRRCRKRTSTVDCALMYASGYSYEEIASCYKIPSGTVRSRISYARKLIRKELENNTLNNV